MTHRGYRDESKANWGTTQDGCLSLEQINCGALLRIADATEQMAKNYVQLQSSLDFYKGRAHRLDAEVATLRRRVAALRGYINRMKK